jgi:Protein of unknown function (DUF2809)
MLTFHRRYFYATLLLFLIEICIAVFVNDRIIRPFVGDVLVVMLVYCFVQSFWRIRSNVARCFADTARVAGVFTFACGVEILQYFNLVDRLGLRQNKPLVVILGSVFDWKDILAYGMGCAIVLGWEYRAKRYRRPSKSLPR